jgi:serine protease Do
MSMNSISNGRRLHPRSLFLFALGLASGPLAAGLLAAGSELPDIRRDATVAAIEQVMPSVVNIATKNIVRVRDPFDGFFNQFWDPYYRRQAPDTAFSLGSGVIIDETGYLLTNDHVVRRADQIAVKFGTSGKVYAATVVASDPKSDVALLKLDAEPGEKFHAIKLAREDDLLLGETVLALGNPFGLGGSVSRGILSSKSRTAPKEGEKLDVPNWLQTDASINPGNSGGPLVNLHGDLIGINVAVLNNVNGEPAQGIGFAIPIKRVIEALSEIFPTEFVKSFWFGARVKFGTPPLLITSVQPESPAGRAGLNVGDTVVLVNGRTPKSFIDFAGLLAAGAGSEETLTVRRGLDQHRLAVRLVPETTVFNADLIHRKLGLGLERVADGFVITAVQEGSPAGEKGLQSGMLVRHIDDETPPPDLTGLAKLIYAKKSGEALRLNVAVQQRVGDFNVLRTGDVELVPR